MKCTCCLKKKYKLVKQKDISEQIEKLEQNEKLKLEQEERAKARMESERKRKSVNIKK